MPRAVPHAVAVGVMPNSLCSAFTQSQVWENRINEYADGRTQREGETNLDNSRRSWRISKRLTAELLTELRDFYDAHNNTAFWFYDHQESTPIGNFDGTGASENGRFIVRFAGPWDQSKGVERAVATIGLVEVTVAFTDGEGWFFDTENASAQILTAGF